jgi:hypothetical protein
VAWVARVPLVTRLFAQPVRLIKQSYSLCSSQHGVEIVGRSISDLHCVVLATAGNSYCLAKDRQNPEFWSFLGLGENRRSDQSQWAPLVKKLLKQIVERYIQTFIGPWICALYSYSSICFLIYSWWHRILWCPYFTLFSVLIIFERNTTTHSFRLARLFFLKKEKMVKKYFLNVLTVEKKSLFNPNPQCP